MHPEGAPTALADSRVASASARWPLLLYAAQQNVGWVLGSVLLVAYLITWVVLSPMPLQDFPTHLARAVVMDDLIFHGGSQFGQVYQFHFLFIPYVLGDVLFAWAVELLGPSLAGTLWCAASFVSFPLAVIIYLRLTRFATQHAALLFILSLYLASDRFFLAGFMSFRLGVALTLVILGIAERFRRDSSGAWFAAYAVGILLAYLLHLSTTVFLTAAIGVSAMLRLYTRTTELRTETLLGLPLAAVLVWNFLVADGYRIPTDIVENPYYWGTVPAKAARLGSELLRFRPGADKLLALLLAGCALSALRPLRRGWLKRPAVLEMFALSATFLALYLILPLSYSDAWDVDARALPLATLFLILGCCGVATEDRQRQWPWTRFALPVAALLTSANLALLVHELAPRSAWLAQYRTVVAALPLHARVFPIFSRPVHLLAPQLHANSFVTIDRAGTIPYEFAGDNGSTMRYFRYRERPYDPPETWYSAVPPGTIDWRAVACAYDYVLITQPYDMRRIPLKVRMIQDNSSAALFAIADAGQGCTAAKGSVPGAGTDTTPQS